METTKAAAAKEEKESVAKTLILTYSYVALWIGLSAAVILINKYILAYAGFPFPIALTLSHMGFCSALAFVLVEAGVSPTVDMSKDTYMRCVLPIAGLFSVTLWLGNAAYLYLSVAFIQMIKALMPASVYTAGILFGTESYENNIAVNMVIVTFGVMLASYGELNFNLIGVLCQAGSLVSESSRLVLIQILLQRRGIKLNPVTTLYYIAPACFCFLLIPFAFIELPTLMNTTDWEFVPGLLLASCSVAFCLNMAVFLLIGKSSALTMNVAGVIKDWLLIFMSVLMFGSPITGLQLFGYGIAFGGVCWYNYLKYKQMQEKAAQDAAAAKQANAEEGKPLLSGDSK